MIMVIIIMIFFKYFIDKIKPYYLSKKIDACKLRF